MCAETACVCKPQDPRDIIELFSLRMPGFFEATLGNPKLLRVVGTLFGGHTAGRPFAQVPAAGVTAEGAAVLCVKDSQVWICKMSCLLQWCAGAAALPGQRAAAGHTGGPLLPRCGRTSSDAQHRSCFPDASTVMPVSM